MLTRLIAETAFVALQLPARPWVVGAINVPVEGD